MRKHNTQDRYFALKVSLIYAAAGILWIFLSDKMLAISVKDAATLTLMQTFKGGLYVAATAALLYILIRRYLISIRCSEDALQESQRTLSTLLDNLPGIAYRCRNDDNWTMEFISDGSRELIGYGPSELTENRSITFASLIHPDDREAVWGSVQAALKEGRPFRIIYRIMDASGSCKWVWEQGRGIIARDGTLEAIEGFITDITDKKKAEEELDRYREHLEELVEERTRDLEAAQKALVRKEKLKTLGSVAAEVAHEIRNPLVSIGGFARRLKRKLPGTAEVDIIVSEAQKLETILNRIRNYLNPVEPHDQECSFNAVVSEALELIASELVRNEILWEVELDPELQPAYGDSEALSEAIINLLRNMLKSMRKPGVLYVRTFHEEQSIHLEFKAQMKRSVLSGFGAEALLPVDDQPVEYGALSFSFHSLKKMGGLIAINKEDDTVSFVISLPRVIGPSILIRPKLEDGVGAQDYFTQ